LEAVRTDTPARSATSRSPTAMASSRPKFFPQPIAALHCNVAN
jgi:hypothetical protein